MMQAKGLEPTVSVTGGDFSMETSQDMAARAIANAEGNAAIALDETARLATKTAKNLADLLSLASRSPSAWTTYAARRRVKTTSSAWGSSSPSRRAKKRSSTRWSR